MNAVLPEAPPARNAADRAAHGFALVQAWIRSEPMIGLLEILDRPVVAHQTGDTAGWLHFNEELPAWLHPLFQEPRVQVGALSPAQNQLLRHTLAVERVAATAFNFRAQDGVNYRERSQAVNADFSEATRERVLELTTALGLVSPTSPRSSTYDKTLVLGGGYQSPQLRARYAAQLQGDGVTWARSASWAALASSSTNHPKSR